MRNLFERRILGCSHAGLFCCWMIMGPTYLLIFRIEQNPSNLTVTEMPDIT